MPNIQTTNPDIGDKKRTRNRKAESRPEPIYDRAEHAPNALDRLHDPKKRRKSQTERLVPAVAARGPS